MVVPHGGASGKTVTVHGFILVVLFAASVAVVAFALVMVSSYWKSIIDLSQLSVLERRAEREEYKLGVMDKGLGELEEKVAEIDAQSELLVTGHRLDEVRPPAALLPPREKGTGDDLTDAERRLSRIAKDLATVKRRFQKDPAALANVPSIMPCRGWFYRDFGNTVSPFTGRVEMHRGLDIVAPRGTPIVATAAGVVTAAGLEEPMGLTVEIDHGNGFVTRYAHNMRNVVVAGQRVKRGQIIAYMGSTGLSSCTHVHYEVVADGVPVNPRYFILRETPLVTRGAKSKSRS